MAERATPVTILEPAGIDPDLLDHSLSLRFDLGQFDPRITFTRNSSATYFGSDGLLKTAAANEPRIDHDPLTGESLGLLIEEQRTNLLQKSEEFNNALWEKQGIITTPNAAIAPSGLLEAELVSANTSLAKHRLYYSGPSSTGTLSFSIYVKAAGYSKCHIRFEHLSTGASEGHAVFDLAGNGSVSSGPGTIAAVGNGWFRIATYGTVAEANMKPFFYMVDDGDQNTFSGNGMSGFYVWGAQLEAGAFPTSYIRTGASQVTRAADNATMTGENFSSWYRADEGTFFSESRCGGLGSGSAASTVMVATNSQNFMVFGQFIPNRLRAAGAATNNVILADMHDVGITYPSIYYKSVGAYKKDDFAGRIANGSILTDTLGEIPVVTSMSIGSIIAAAGSFSQHQNGHIKRITYYPKRLTNAKLQALTA